MVKFDYKKTRGTGAVVLKNKDYTLMLYLVDGKLWFIDIDCNISQEADSIVGNIYKGKVANTTVNGMAFVDVGIGEDVMLQGSDFAEGEYFLVQIVADKHDGKTYKGTTKITLSSSLAILECKVQKKVDRSNRNLIHYSKELSKDRLKNIKNLENGLISSFGNDGEITSLIIRTNAEDNDNDTVVENITELVNRWKNIRNAFATKIGVGLIEKADDRLAVFTNNYIPHAEFVATNDSDTAKIASRCKKIDIQLFENEDFLDLKEIKAEIDTLSNQRVEVNDNVNFKIDYTEACTFIDVNAGGFKRGKDEEFTKLQINMLASREIMRQISLRNVGGPIIIDFISLPKEEEQALIENFILEAKKDRQKIVIYPEMTKLGMVECTRKRTQRRSEPSAFEILFSRLNLTKI